MAMLLGHGCEDENQGMFESTFRFSFYFSIGEETHRSFWCCFYLSTVNNGRSNSPKNWRKNEKRKPDWRDRKGKQYGQQNGGHRMKNI